MPALRPRPLLLATVLLGAGPLACGDDIVQGSFSASQASSGGTTASTTGTTTDSTTDGTSTGDATTSGTTTAAPTTSGGSASGTTTTASTTAGTSATTASTTGEPLPTDCCVVHDTSGCANSQIQNCVCAADLNCCVPGNSWDLTCVTEVTSFGCGMCPKP